MASSPLSKNFGRRGGLAPTKESVLEDYEKQFTCHLKGRGCPIPNFLKKHEDANICMGCGTAKRDAVPKPGYWYCSTYCCGFQSVGDKCANCQTPRDGREGPYGFHGGILNTNVTNSEDFLHFPRRTLCQGSTTCVASFLPYDGQRHNALTGKDCKKETWVDADNNSTSKSNLHELEMDSIHLYREIQTCETSLTISQHILKELVHRLHDNQGVELCRKN